MTILSTIMGVESGGGHNILQGSIGDINNQRAAAGGGSYQLAQGYFQITGPTWAQFGGNAYAATPLQATYAQQLAVAQNIPVSRWGGATQTALTSAGYSPQRGQTLGQLMAANNEDPSATVAADGSSVSGSGSTLANGPTDGGSGANVVGPDSNPLGTSVTENPSGASSTTSSGTGTAQGTQIQTALQPEETSFITSTVQGIENAFGGGLKATLTAAETGLATYFAGIQNWFVRAGLILLGVILLGVALVALMWERGGEKIAQQAQTFARV
jgi:hypothetical protein